MNSFIRISLSLPTLNERYNYFTLKIKSELQNERSEFDKCNKLLAISDIEGNFHQFTRLLIKCRVIDRHFEWIFRDGHLVILGDCFDRGEHVIECLWLIYYLEERARKRGGHVHFILGNHEIMNINGDWRYVHPKYAPHTKSQRPLAAMYDGNSELWRWLFTKNIIEKIGDVLFVHGGISSELLKLGYSVTEINNCVRPYYAQAEKFYSDPLLKAVFNSAESPFWFRGYYQSSANEETINETLKHFKVNTIVTGHTVVAKVSSFYNGKVINTDTDHSIGNSEALLINKNKFYRILSTGKREKIK
jgi:hypothetical protein